MGRPKSNGPYAKLSATYFYDDAVLEAGPDAELLWVRSLAFLASGDSDGFITDRQMRQIVGLGLRNVTKRINSLQEVGLLVTSPGGFAARSWTKWNKTAEEIGKNLKRDRERKSQNHADKGVNSGRNETGIHTDSATQYKAIQINTSQDNTYVAERADVSEVCNLLAKLIEANGSKRPLVGKTWLNDARLMLDLDNRDLAGALRLIRWCQSDPFWKANILSMSKFRQKYDQLRLSANRQIEDRKLTRTEQNLETVAMYAAQEQIEVTA